MIGKKIPDELSTGMQKLEAILVKSKKDYERGKQAGSRAEEPFIIGLTQFDALTQILPKNLGYRNGYLQ